MYISNPLEYSLAWIVVASCLLIPGCGHLIPTLQVLLRPTSLKIEETVCLPQLTVEPRSFSALSAVSTGIMSPPQPIKEQCESKLFAPNASNKLRPQHPIPSRKQNRLNHRRCARHRRRNSSTLQSPRRKCCNRRSSPIPRCRRAPNIIIHTPPACDIRSWRYR